MNNLRRPPPDANFPARKFTHHGVEYDLMRLSPDFNAEATAFSPHKTVSVKLPVFIGSVYVEAKASVKTHGLIYVLVKDDVGEVFGIWCFIEDVIFEG
ncbi:hypothetical protein AUR04nite_34730 [Glutamicibacter uratoxydans]|uniref:Uncharacterized protein n=1 Tax=Glutamicibacter uratoxydans TaxID=43667 RepID=A0A4Y4E006_GLUUR|nr:hypothetical protein AUR04nite_34730 [Glutamicibacter uratoxydans]